ncbi:2OG-Fe(II) oxygenase [Pseudanabaena sp. ABRG5-3]|uniref:2OG-Fe(II) oxygenase n=1 Tax=Pseudanabaena sp. ABRG5-3 TaxID=685565 RepID=UPI000DC7282F|nr:2OG-Fe(II) oxygenase [Pseudanabaena sp. ABRG5-3]BBC24313.1 hypothetical protein ABRG53_2056 [Pseudanabaena sp. ABRG5-3]
MKSLYQLRYLRPDNLYPLYYLTNKVVNKLLSLPSDIACGFNSNDWFEQLILLPRYQNMLRQHKDHLPRIDDNEQNIVDQLEQNGVCITSLDALLIPDSHKLLEAAQPITNELAQQSRSPSHLGKHTLMANADQLLAHPEIIRWGLSERLLKIVECYLGLPVGYGALSFYYSVADGRDAGPRIWHRDKEDWKMVKVAVYLNDVDEFGGPFQCVKSDINKFLIETLPQYKGLTNSELEQLLKTNNPDEYLTSCVGKTGTVIFTDTSKYYHRGKPPSKSDRSAVFFHYFSYRPKNPFYCDRSPLSSNQIVEFDKQLPIHLQGYLTWREQCPGLGRYIPKNQMKVDNW